MGRCAEDDDPSAHSHHCPRVEPREGEQEERQAAKKEQEKSLEP